MAIGIGDIVSGGIGALIGGLFGGNNPPQTTTAQNIPAYLDSALQDLVSRGREYSNEPYFNFPGQRVAQLTPDQLAGFDLTRGAAGVYKPYLDQAGSTLSGIPGAFTYDEFAQRSNPFQQAVTDETTKEILRQAGFQERNIQDEVIRTGNFGGSRAGVRLAELDRTTMDTIARTLASNNMANFGQAQNQFNVDRQLQASKASGLAGIGQLSQNLALTGAGAYGIIGGQQQAQNQASLDVGYQDFLAQRGDPFNKLTQFASLIRGNPQNQTTTVTGQAPNPLSQALGGGIGAIGLYREFFK